MHPCDTNFVKKMSYIKRYSSLSKKIALWSFLLKYEYTLYFHLFCILHILKISHLLKLCKISLRPPAWKEQNILSYLTYFLLNTDNILVMIMIMVLVVANKNKIKSIQSIKKITSTFFSKNSLPYGTKHRVINLL